MLPGWKDHFRATFEVAARICEQEIAPADREAEVPA